MDLFYKVSTDTLQFLKGIRSLYSMYSLLYFSFKGEVRIISESRIELLSWCTPLKSKNVKLGYWQLISMGLKSQIHYELPVFLW